MAALPFTGNSIHKSEIEYNRKFGHNIFRIHHISLMIRIGIFCTSFHLVTQTVSPTLPGFQGRKRCIKYMSSHTHKPILYPYNSYYGSNLIRLAWSGDKVEDYTIQNGLEYYQDA